jgi:hypothetical protein
MRVDTDRQLFVGVKIDGRMREQLERCPARDRLYFEATDGQFRYLAVVRGKGEENYVGKVLPPGSALGQLDDVLRNVWSILNRICPGRRDQGEVKLFSLAGIEAEPTLLPAGGAASSPYGAGLPGRPGELRRGFPSASPTAPSERGIGEPRVGGSGGKSDDDDPEGGDTDDYY